MTEEIGKTPTTVLVVDDEDNILRAISRLLSRSRKQMTHWEGKLGRVSRNLTN